MKEILKTQKGFTILELMIVTAIIGLLAAGVLLGFRSSTNNYTLGQAAQQLVSDLRRVQNMALNGVAVFGYNDFGIYIQDNATSYIIYADVNGNRTYQPSDLEIETVSFPQGGLIDSTTPISSRIDVFFESPDPTTYINNNSSIGVSGTVTVGAKGYSETKTITITTAGLIEIN